MAASSSKVQTLHLILLTLHAISALSLMNSHSFWPNLWTVYILLFSYLSTSIYLFISWSQNS